MFFPRALSKTPITHSYRHTALSGISGEMYSQSSYSGSEWLDQVLVYVLYCRYTAQLVCIICIGVVIVGVYILMPSTCIEILGVEYISSAVGTGSFMYGIGFLTGPPLGGKEFE